jgi:hypothetical protein
MVDGIVAALERINRDPLGAGRDFDGGGERVFVGRRSEEDA